MFRRSLRTNGNAGRAFDNDPYDARLAVLSVLIRVKHVLDRIVHRAQMGPNGFLTTAADRIEHESTYLRSPSNRRLDFGRRKFRLFGAETGRLRLLYQQQWTSGAASMR